MAEIVRIGVSVDGPLLERFDRLLEERGIGNRSEALRDLIRDSLVDAELDDQSEAIGAVTLVFDHRKRDLSSGLTSLQHDHSSHVISSMHVHVDADHCLEVIVLKGRTGQIKRLSARMMGAKGVLHGKIAITSLEALTGEPTADAGGEMHGHG